MREMPKILIVEDDGIIAKDLQNILTSIGYVVPGIASNADEAVSKFDLYKPDLIIMDIVLKGYSDGIETASRLRSKRNVPVVYLTAHTDDMTLVRAKITEPFGYILKPFDEKELLITVEMALYKYEMESKLRESEETLRALLNATNDSAILTTADGTILALNQTAVRVIGKDSDSAVGKNVSEVIPPFMLHSSRESISAVLNTGISTCYEEERDGLTLEHSIHPVTDKEGNISRIAIYTKNITERKNQEKSLRNAISELASAQKELIQSEKMASLGSFASGIAHEIRNPLANISACAQFCITKLGVEEKTKEHLNVILRNTERANQIIKDLLDYARPSDFNVQQTDIVKVLNKALNLVKSRCEKQGVEIKKILPKKGMMLFIDEKWMLNAFLNIITNALDSMEKGGELLVELIKNTESVILKFTDDGKGIPSEIIDNIFEPFFTTKRSGVGLGLPLTQRVVDAHKGKIHIENNVDNGTTVSIQLPF